jgi:YD repeat-containing protein
LGIFRQIIDAVGNRLTKNPLCPPLEKGDENGFTTTYQYDANNRLIREDDVRYSYDDNGNLTEKDSAEEDVLYFYDAENHLIRVETTRFGATIVVGYAYDDAGNRVRKTIDDTVVINYLVDTNRDYAQVLGERDESSSGDSLPTMPLIWCVPRRDQESVWCWFGSMPRSLSMAAKRRHS